MILNLQLVNQEYYDCLESALATVLNWFGCTPEFMAVDSWGFRFTPPGPEETVGDKLDNPTTQLFKVLCRYYAINVTQHLISPPQGLALLEKELREERPCLIGMDCFWYPWEAAYQKEHTNPHMCLVNGMDQSRSMLYCCDPHRNKTNLELTYSDFLQGFVGALAFTYLSEEKKPVEWREIILHSVNKLQPPNSTGEVLGAMRQLADAIEQLDYSRELADVTNFHNARLNVALKKVGDGRMLFATLLQYLVDRFDLKALQTPAREMALLGKRWLAVRNISLKACFARNYSLRGKMASKIREAADHEEQILGYFKQLIQHEDIADHSYAISKVDCPVRHAVHGQNPVLLELVPHFNNQGFGVGEETMANLTGDGIFILPDHRMKEEIWNVEGAPFRFPRIGEGIFDNISCGGEVVMVPFGYYSRLWILGCGEWGNQIDEIFLVQPDGSFRPVTLGISDGFQEPVFLERVAWEGFAQRNAKPEMTPGSKVCLFAQCLDLDGSVPFAGIKLPFKPNLHIFAMTLISS